MILIFILCLITYKIEEENIRLQITNEGLNILLIKYIMKNIGYEGIKYKILRNCKYWNALSLFLLKIKFQSN